MEKVTENVYAELGFNGCNVSFVVTKQGVVMVDTPQIPSEAIQWRDEIEKHGPVRYLINFAQVLIAWLGAKPLSGDWRYSPINEVQFLFFILILILTLILKTGHFANC